MRFLILKTEPEAHAYSQFAAGLHAALSANGHQADLSPQTIGQPLGLARALNGTRYDAVVSFSSIFGDAGVVETGQSLFDLMGVKFVGWQFDHPVYVHHALAKRMENRRSIYPHRNHVRFADALKIGGRSTAMLPGARTLDEPVRDYDDRKHQIFIAATWNGAPERVWEALGDSPAKKLFVEVVDRLMNDREASVIDAFNASARRLGMKIQLGVDSAFDEGIVALLRGPLTYVRDSDRLNAIQTLVEAGLPVTLCGPGWRGHLGDRKNLTFNEDRIPFAAMQRTYNDAKVVLNLNAGNGGCERALDAMAAGAAVVSEYSGSLAETFAPGEQIAFYNRARPSEIVEVAGALLESGRGESLAEAGHARVIQTALWRHQAERLAAFLA